jgi:hemerythrin superfamily protein
MTVPEDVLRKEPYGPDLVEVVRRDHSEMAGALARLLEVRDPDERRQGFRAVARQLSVHEAAEEEVVYPYLAGLGPEAGEVRSRRLEEERQSKRLLARMLREELLNPAGRRFRHNLELLHALVRAHAAAEEAEVLPLLAGAEGDTKLRVLATMFDQAKATAPTRPHPHGPDRLGGLLATTPVLAVVDRVRDLGRRVIAR